ncbi:SAM-dependent methyltransferase [Wenzhouxiangella sediminis]|uniref:Class I SAM-dependent methyltransferase n=1 Tax=Wenzhouxiangella sediminis TaxID=1792836 RepID=A0A3E1K6V3_9GAMM|nr:class I SAM-dependent methyltransferase [Wenzhouxiangella sediminis]RFF29744.1 class I SAM-dependent methyltransferase [Wenzhouxiangella sediminis]
MSANPEMLATADPALSERFAERIGGMINDSAVIVMIALGHRLGLFDAMGDSDRQTSPQLARRTGLAERYVREWLSVMATSRIVEYDPAERTFQLPPEHAASLTRSASPDNLAVTARFIPLLARMEEPIMACFRSGEGLAYDDYPCFHEVMAEDSFQTVVCALFDTIIPMVPQLQERLEAGIRVLDAGCGRGLALVEMARRYPCSEFVGYDLCAEAFEPTRARCREEGLDNVRFEARDLRDFDEPGSFDFIASFDAVHDQADPQRLLDGIARALRPGGVYLMQDIAGSSHLENNMAHPLGPLIYAISCVHCTPVSLGQGGPGLGTMWGEELARSMLESAGFGHIVSHKLEHDPFNVYFIASHDERPRA